jgi:hypothetical protein
MVLPDLLLLLDRSFASAFETLAQRALLGL